mmetsp:Transcript_317/g.471  ORF Transcript_317/g.471 Transcript_317/m.471 type:complete len:209 (+) Transcript_317:161-787(+)
MVISSCGGGTSTTCSKSSSSKTGSGNSSLNPSARKSLMHSMASTVAARTKNSKKPFFVSPYLLESTPSIVSSQNSCGMGSLLVAAYIADISEKERIPSESMSYASKMASRARLKTGNGTPSSSMSIVLAFRFCRKSIPSSSETVFSSSPKYPPFSSRASSIFFMFIESSSGDFSPMNSSSSSFQRSPPPRSSCLDSLPTGSSSAHTLM